MTPLNYLSDASFEVETKETQLLKVIVPMPKVTPIIGEKQLGAAFEKRIIHAANLLVGNYNITEHNACTGGLIVCLSWWVCSASPVQSPLPVLQGNKRLLCDVGSGIEESYRRRRKRLKGSSRSRDQTSAQELALAKPMKQRKKIISQSSGLSATEKSSSVTVKITREKHPQPPLFL
jgi:hypothetical protein